MGALHDVQQPLGHQHQGQGLLAPLRPSIDSAYQGGSASRRMVVWKVYVGDEVPLEPRTEEGLSQSRIKQ